MNDKFIKKYMRMAKFVAEDQNPCYSRNIGVVLVDPVANRVIGTGYNGPPKGVPHTDDPEYLQEVVWPQLTDAEKANANCTFVNNFVEKYGNCATCPRKVVGAASGTRLELCSCAHGEANCIVNAAADTHGSYMFCYCGVPCIECTKLIINAGVKKVYCIKWDKDYSVGSRWLFAKRGVELIVLEKEFFEN
jgi:dCMP deaminase